MIILWWLGPWIERSGKEILYDYFKKVQPALCEWFEMRLGPIVGVRLAPRLGYMFLHFVSIIGFGATSFFLWHSFLLHTLFMVCSPSSPSTTARRTPQLAFRYAQKKLNDSSARSKIPVHTRLTPHEPADRMRRRRAQHETPGQERRRRTRDPAARELEPLASFN